MATESDHPEPTISLSALEHLADEAEIVGAQRYAEAYRLVAKYLRTFDEEQNGE
jgi:hypothetical protein